jgi:hypothetical protein
MFPNSTTTQLTLVLGKNILVSFQNFPELMLSSLIQIAIYPNSLIDLSPPRTHFFMAKGSQSRGSTTIRVVILDLNNLSQRRD